MLKPRTSLNEIYRRLRRRYGPQGWWPTTPPRSTKPQYLGGPTTKKQQLEVIIGAILTQNTSWRNVETCLQRLSEEALIDVKAISNTPEKILASYIRSSGYFNEKAKKLKAAAKFLRAHPIKELEAVKTEELREMLLSVKGIGPETADSILLYAFSRPKFVVDAYTKRIFSRLNFIEGTSSYQQVQELFETRLRKNTKTYNQFHALIVQHGKEVCKPKPCCARCALQSCCAHSGKVRKEGDRR